MNENDLPPILICIALIVACLSATLCKTHAQHCKSLDFRTDLQSKVENVAATHSGVQVDSCVKCHVKK